MSDRKKPVVLKVLSKCFSLYPSNNYCSNYNKIRPNYDQWEETKIKIVVTLKKSKINVQKSKGSAIENAVTDRMEMKPLVKKKKR